MGSITAVLIGGPNDLTKMKLSHAPPELRFMLAPDPQTMRFSDEASPVVSRFREAIYRPSNYVHPVHSGNVLIYVYDGEKPS